MNQDQQRGRRPFEIPESSFHYLKERLQEGQSYRFRDSADRIVHVSKPVSLERSSRAAIVVMLLNDDSQNFSKATFQRSSSSSAAGIIAHCSFEMTDESQIRMTVIKSPTDLNDQRVLPGLLEEAAHRLRD